MGPMSIAALKQDRYMRVTIGRLPEAHLAFIDESWKASSAVLNCLLKLLDERAFDNGGVDPVRFQPMSPLMHTRCGCHALGSCAMCATRPSSTICRSAFVATSRSHPKWRSVRCKMVESATRTSVHANA